MRGRRSSRSFHSSNRSDLIHAGSGVAVRYAGSKMDGLTYVELAHNFCAMKRFGQATRKGGQNAYLSVRNPAQRFATT
jgi:hypothetical protein